jgi:hypothetical protein
MVSILLPDERDRRKSRNADPSIIPILSCPSTSPPFQPFWPTRICEELTFRMCVADVDAVVNSIRPPITFYSYLSVFHSIKVNRKPMKLALQFLPTGGSASSPRIPAIHLFLLFAYKAKEDVPLIRKRRFGDTLPSKGLTHHSPRTQNKIDSFLPSLSEEGMPLL